MFIMKELQIKEFREKIGLTQEEFAQKIGVSTRTVQNWENGGEIPKTTRKKLETMIQQESQCQANDYISRILDMMEEDRRFFRESITRSQNEIDRLIALFEKQYGIENPLFKEKTA
jgi:DNA-binding XRE family transcriptional regulator